MSLLGLGKVLILPGFMKDYDKALRLVKSQDEIQVPQLGFKVTWLMLYLLD